MILLWSLRTSYDIKRTNSSVEKYLYVLTTHTFKNRVEVSASTSSSDLPYHYSRPRRPHTHRSLICTNVIVVTEPVTLTLSRKTLDLLWQKSTFLPVHVLDASHNSFPHRNSEVHLQHDFFKISPRLLRCLYIDVKSSIMQGSSRRVIRTGASDLLRPFVAYARPFFWHCSPFNQFY